MNIYIEEILLSKEGSSHVPIVFKCFSTVQFCQLKNGNIILASTVFRISSV